MLNTETKQPTKTPFESATALPVNLANGLSLHHACLWLQENEESDTEEYQSHVDVFSALIEATSVPLEA
tara:strand:- start:61 stop:267 length:207 start_codon:yes stop_codon:yes gene_type:complete